MGKKRKELKNPELVEKLAVLIAEKMGRDDKLDEVVHKFIDDYLNAKKIINKIRRGHSKKKKVEVFEMEAKKVRPAPLVTVPIKSGKTVM